MALQINIRDLTKQAHGLSDFPDVPDYDLSQMGLNATGRDALGRLYFMDVALSSTLLGETWRMPNEPLVRVGKQKNVVETIIAGNEVESGGTVIEQINKGTFNIDIYGIIINENKTAPQYPQDEVRKLVEFCESGEALGVDCDLLELLFDVRKLVVRSYDLDAMEGQPYHQRFRIQCTSYQDFYADLDLQNLVN